MGQPYHPIWHPCQSHLKQQMKLLLLHTYLLCHNQVPEILQANHRELVGVTGFEPAASCSQSRRATNCATPRCSREALIKSGMQIAQTDFSSDCTKVTQEYLMYFKEFSCNMTKNKQVKCVPRFIQRFPRLLFYHNSCDLSILSNKTLAFSFSGCYNVIVIIILFTA